MKKHFAVLLFPVIVNLTTGAQEPELFDNNAQVSVQTIYESSLITGKTWTFTLIIDYPDPDQVTVAAPAFGAFTQERSFKSPRLIDDRIQTVVEYRLIPNRTGRFTLESFVVICPSGIKKTEPLFLNITAETQELKPIILKLVWEGVPVKIETGERCTISLFSNVQDSKQLPPGFFTPEVPLGLVLSSLKLTEQEKINSIYAKFDIIPLEGNIYFPSRILQFENTVYEISSLRITVMNRTTVNNTGISGEEKTKLPFDEENFILSNMTKENKKVRIIRLIYFYSGLFLVIFTIFACLYLLLKKK
jgi:hypothetical protein